MPKLEYSALDAAPAVLYAKKTDNNSTAYPVLIDESGALQVSTSGFGATDNLTITETVAAPLDTFVITNGVKTKTIVINSTTKVITITWS